MKSFLEGMTGIQKLLLIVFVITNAVSIFFYYKEGPVTAIVVSILVFIFLLITSAIWQPSRSRNVQVRLLSLGFASAAVFSLGFWQQFIENSVQLLIQKYIPAFNEYQIDSVAPELILAFVLGAIFIVNYFNRDKTAMGVHPSPIEEDIPERSFGEKFKSVCDFFADDLRSIDIRTNWSTKYFTPLNAEVEISTKNGKQKKVLDLLKAIKRSNARLFLVLGDPGSGKSVALRKLCQDLLQEANKTGKIPIYINLKEWIVDNKWNEVNPPKFEELEKFILENLKRDIVTSKFFNQYYDKLYDTGRLYFVFDSFDEIPSVLDENDNSELIQQLSQVLFRFLKGARAEQSQGILASRSFRRPTKEFQVDSTLSIRPFSEESIIKSFKLRGQYNEELLRKLFKDRPELVPIASNPFSATLIAEYLENNDNKLPATQSEMYASYINRTLDSCQNELRKKGLSNQDVIKCAVQIANGMFSNYGLEAPIYRLREYLIDHNVDGVVQVLKFARLGRGTTSNDNTFSFVHRRFAEYFYVQIMLADDKYINLQDIPNDSQQRDALVLYCEVADDEKVKYIAGFCWNTIKSINDPQDIRTIHCMRFLRDAYKGRPACTQHIIKDFAKYVSTQINTSSSIISMKLALETVGLLNEEDIEKTLIKALEIGNYWTNETAFKSCRYLSKISPSLENKINNYINNIPFVKFIQQRNNIMFLLSLSEIYNKIKRHFLIRLTDYVFFIIINISFAIAGIWFPHIYIYFWAFAVCMLGLLFIKLSTEALDLKFSHQINLEQPYVIDLKQELGLTRINIDIIRKAASFMLVAILGLMYIAQKLFKKGLDTSVMDWTQIAALGVLTYPYHTIINDFNSTKKTLSSPKFYYNLIPILISMAILAISFSYSHKVFESNTFKIISLIITIIGFALLTYRIVRKYFLIYTENKKITKVDIEKINTRNQIYNLYNSIKFEENKVRFLKRLEHTTKNVTGEWPSKDIFKLDNNNSTVILAKLEIRWRGIDD